MGAGGESCRWYVVRSGSSSAIFLLPAPAAYYSHYCRTQDTAASSSVERGEHLILTAWRRASRISTCIQSCCSPSTSPPSSPPSPAVRSLFSSRTPSPRTGSSSSSPPSLPLVSLLHLLTSSPTKTPSKDSSMHSLGFPRN